MKIKDLRYDFHITVSSHIIIENRKHQILLAKRPHNWEWAPGRWGLPGGKIYQHESFIESIKRKTKQELGFVLLPKGLFQLKQLIIRDKQAMMFFFASRYENQKITGEMADYMWFDIDRIRKTPSKEYSEFFYKKMLAGYLEKPNKILPIDFIESLNYIKLSGVKSYKNWFEGIINKNYDPEKIADYKKWKLTKR